MPTSTMKRAIEDNILSILSTTLTTQVLTYDRYLHDVPQTLLPYLAVMCRGGTHQVSEIGTQADLVEYDVQIYYMDINADFPTGDLKRNDITAKAEVALMNNPRLNNCTVVLPSPSQRESVYQSYINSVLFDSSGQDGYYSFVSEMSFTVQTSKT